MADDATFRAPPRRPTARQVRAALEMAVERLLTAAEAVLEDLDAIDGDADIEPSLGSSDHRDQRRWASGYDAQDSEREDVSEDEGAACEGEGDHDEREPEQGNMCNWADDLEDQRDLKPAPVFALRPPGIRSPHQNVGPMTPVRQGLSGIHVPVRVLP